MGKLTGLFNRGGSNTGDVIRQSTSLTMAYLLEQNRKFEAFMRDKVAELEGRVAAQQQTRLDYFDDDEAASPEVVEDGLDWESEQELEEMRPLVSLAADVDEPLGLSPAGFPPVGFGPVGAAPAAAQEETVPVEPVTVARVAPAEAAEPVQAPPSWLVMLGVGEPEPAREEETGTVLDQDPAEVEPEDEAGWSEAMAWEDTTGGDPDYDPTDEKIEETAEAEPEDEADWPETTVWENTTGGDSSEDPADEEAEEIDAAVAPDPVEEEPEEEDLAHQDWDEAELEEGLTAEEEADGPEVEMPAGIDQDEVELMPGPDGDQEEEGVADPDWTEMNLEQEPAGEEEMDGPDAKMPPGVDQEEAALEQDPAEEMDQGPGDGVTGQNTVRMKVRKQGGVLEVGAGPAIDDEAEDTDTLLPSWLTAKL